MGAEMNLSAIRPSSQNNTASERSSLDTHESRLRKQIADLQEKKKTVSNDKDKTSEEKKKEKQAIQEEIQTLNSELRQYQIQKRQEEAAQKQEALKEAANDSGEKNADREYDPAAAVFGNKESGVLISLSATKDQLLNMRRIRSDLARRQRTAVTDEEKTDLQKKMNTVAKNIGRKVTITEETVSKFRDSKKKGTDAKPDNHQNFDWKEPSEIVNTANDPEEPYRGNLIQNRKKFFSTVSIFIK